MSVDLTTTYLGLTLANPIVASSSPLTGDLEMLRRLEEAGIAAAVLPSLFQEQIEHEEVERHRQYEAGTFFEESASYIPSLQDYNAGVLRYLQYIEAAKKAVSIPIIASLNAASDASWTQSAKSLQDAGADALELNLYFLPTNPGENSEAVEQRYTAIVAGIRSSISIPLAVKIGPFFTSLPHFARALVDAGADGLVLFNRFLEPDIDLELMSVRPELVLSNRYEVRLPLRWIAILRDQLNVSLAATSGIHRAEDVIKVLLAGADVAMVAAVLLRYGPPQVVKLLEELEHWLRASGYRSVTEVKATMSRAPGNEMSAYERVQYMKAILSFSEDDRAL